MRSSPRLRPSAAPPIRRPCLLDRGRLRPPLLGDDREWLRRLCQSLQVPLPAAAGTGLRGPPPVAVPARCRALDRDALRDRARARRPLGAARPPLPADARRALPRQRQPPDRARDRRRLQVAGDLVGRPPDEDDAGDRPRLVRVPARCDLAIALGVCRRSHARRLPSALHSAGNAFASAGGVVIYNADVQRLSPADSGLAVDVAAARGDVALGATAAVTAVSFVLAPQLWREFVDAMTVQAPAAIDVPPAAIQISLPNSSRAGPRRRRVRRPDRSLLARPGRGHDRGASALVERLRDSVVACVPLLEGRGVTKPLIAPWPVRRAGPAPAPGPASASEASAARA